MHGGLANPCKVHLHYVDRETMEPRSAKALSVLEDVDAILVPGGFGTRGIEGKIAAIGYARENQIPFFGICLGMQCAVIEYARSVLDLAGANSTEFDEESAYPVIHLMEAQKTVIKKGATMRLGSYPARLIEGSHIRAAYGVKKIDERHRHRYEFNNAFRDQLEEAGMKASAVNTELELVEGVEVEGHPYFVGVQFHPEYKSKPLAPHPLFASFVAAALAAKRGVETDGSEEAQSA